MQLFIVLGGKMPKYQIEFRVTSRYGMDYGRGGERIKTEKPIEFPNEIKKDEYLFFINKEEKELRYQVSGVYHYPCKGYSKIETFTIVNLGYGHTKEQEVEHFKKEVRERERIVEMLNKLGS